MVTDWQLPDAPLRTSVIGTNAALLVIVAVVATFIRSPLQLSEDYPLKASGIFSVTMLLALGFVRAGHPFADFGYANRITAARAALVALVAGLLGESVAPNAASWAAAASLICAALDGADGWCARRAGMASPFGARFDMETDALLILVLSALAWQLGKAGAWIVIAGLFRYIFVVAGWVLSWMRRDLPQSRRRQAVCVLQIVGSSVVVLPWIGPPSSVWLSAMLLGTLFTSFMIDTLWLWTHRE